MNKKFLSAILFGALMVTSTGTFVSCKDYDDDIENLQGQISANTTAIAELKALLGDGNYVTSISVNGQNLVVNTKNGSTTVALPACKGGSLAEVKGGELFIDGEATGIKVAAGEAVKIEAGEWAILQADGSYKSTGIPASGVTVTGDKKNGYVLTITDAEGVETVVELPTAASLITSIDVVGDPFASVVVKKALFAKPDSWAGKRELPSNNSYVYGVNSLDIRINPVSAPAEDVEFYLTNTKNHTLSNLKFYAAASQDSNAGAMTSGNINGRAAVTGNGLWTLKMDQFVLDADAAKLFNKDINDNTGNVVYAVDANKVARSKYNVLVGTQDAKELTKVRIVSMNDSESVINGRGYAKKHITVNVGQTYKIDEITAEDGLMWDMYFSAASETVVETYGLVFDHLNRTFTVTKRPDVVTTQTSFDLNVNTLDINGKTGTAKYNVSLSSKIEGALAYDAVEYNLANLNISGASRTFTLPISALKEAMGENWTTWANSVDLTKTKVEAYSNSNFTTKVADITGASSATGLSYSLRTSNGAETTSVNDLNNIRFTVSAGDKTYTVDTQYYIKVAFNTAGSMLTSPSSINYVSVPVMFTAPTVADQFALKAGYVVEDVVNAYYYDYESTNVADRKSVQLNHYFDKADEDANITLDTQTTLATLSDGTALKSAHLAVLKDQVVTSGVITTYSKINGKIYLNSTYSMSDGTNRELGYGKNLIVKASNDNYDGWKYKTEAQTAYSFTIKLMSPIFEGAIKPVSGQTINVTANAETGFAITKSMIELTDYNSNLYCVVPDANGVQPNNEEGGNDAWKAAQINDVWVTKDANNTYIKKFSMQSYEEAADGKVTQEGAIVLYADPLPTTTETSMKVNVKDCWGYKKTQEVSVTIVKQ